MRNAYLQDHFDRILTYPTRHLVFFVRLRHFDEPLINLARPLTFLQVFVHINLLLLLTPHYNTPLHQLVKEQTELFPPMPWLLGLSCVAPFVSIVLRKSWHQTGWWSVTFFVTVAIKLLMSWTEEEEKNVEELESLRYSAGGA